MTGAGGAVGGLFSLVGALGKYKVSQNLSKEQKERSDELRNEAGQVKAPALRQEFKDVARMKKLGTLSGLPGYEQYREQIAQDTANQLQAGRDAASSGADYLSYAASIQSGANAQARDLKLQDTTQRAGALSDYANTQWNVGNEQLKNEDIRRVERDALLQKSAQLEDAATANKWQGKSDVIGNLVSAGASIAGGAMGGDVVSGLLSGNKAGKSVAPLEQETQAAGEYAAGEQIAGKQTAQFDSRSMMKYGLTMADMAAVQALQAKYPNANMDQLVQMYKKGFAPK